MRRGKTWQGEARQGEARPIARYSLVSAALSQLTRVSFHLVHGSRAIGLSVSLSVVRSGLGRNHIIFSLCVAQCDGDGDSTNGHSRRCGVKHINDNDDDDVDEDADADADGDDDDHNDDQADGDDDDDDDGLDDDDNEMQTPQD